MIIAFSGYWMEANVYGPHADIDKHYAFGIPNTGGWGPMHNLVYVTHECQANNINSATIGNEAILLKHAHTYNPNTDKPTRVILYACRSWAK